MSLTDSSAVVCTPRMLPLAKSFTSMLYISCNDKTNPCLGKVVSHQVVVLHLQSVDGPGSVLEVLLRGEAAVAVTNPAQNTQRLCKYPMGSDMGMQSGVQTGKIVVFPLG